MSHPIEENNAERFAIEKESQYFDRKSARKDPRELARHISGFTNASGGKLVIGIEDDGEITGFKRENAHDITGFKQAPLTECSPIPMVNSTEVSVVNRDGNEDSILVMDIKASVDRVIARKKDGAVFLRQQDKTVELNHEQILALEYDRNQRCFEDEIVRRSSIEDVDTEILAQYKNRIGTNVSDRQALESRGLLVDDCLTNAGVLLFAKNPTQFIPSARVRFLRFEGNKRETGKRFNVVKDRTFDGPLPRVIEEAYRTISEQLREFQYLGDDGIFTSIPEYPEFAWLEGLVNAVTHRNYALSGDYIRISMYDDRLEISSPGTLPNIVTLENMRHTRWSRNPIIARTLTEFGWVREMNEGVQRIYDEMAEFFLNDPVFSEPNNASVLLTLENSITSRVLRDHEPIIDAVGIEKYDSLNEYEVAAVQYVYLRGKITTKILSEQLDRGSTLCSKILKGLVEKNILTWHGTSSNDPSQYYSLPEQ